MSLSYIVYRKDQSNTRGKIREKFGREYDQISQIIKKNVIYKPIWIVNSKKFFYINNVMNLCWLTSLIKFNFDGVIPKPRGMNLASIFQLTTFIR